MKKWKKRLTFFHFYHNIFIKICYVCIVSVTKIGEMPAEMQSKGRWDSLLPYWGQIIAIQYYRVFDTLSNKRNFDACIF